MHLLLTDRLCCPRCGPEFGLILLADRVQNQRVLEGDLGCSNCRDTYPVRSGLADLRPPPRPPASSPGEEAGDETLEPDPDEKEQALRLGALLGINEGPGTLLIQGPAARSSRSLASLLTAVEIVAADPGQAREEEIPGVSRLLVGTRIPFFSGSLQGVLLSGRPDRGAVEEGARILTPGGRLVILAATPETASELSSLGFEVLLEEDGVLVAVKEDRETGNLVTLRGI